MGKRQKKKQARTSRNIRQVQRANASKQAASSPTSIMTPFPMSSGGTSVDDSSSDFHLLNFEDTSCCQHVENGVNLDKLRSQFATKPPMECHECMLGKTDKVATAPVAEKPLWTCLACGQTGCGFQIPEAKDVDQNNSGPTSVSHLETHASQSNHSVVMRWNESLDCRCLECNLQLKYPSVPGQAFAVGDESSNEASKRELLLQQAATLLHENRTRHPTFSKEKDAQMESDQVAKVDEGDSRSSSNHTIEVKPARSFATRSVMKGLMNLGNTCFFNSVMQNLVGVRMLREHFGKETIAQEGVLKSSLRNFFQEMDSNPVQKLAGVDVVERSIRTCSFGIGNVGSAVSPKILFSEICKKAPRFRGFQQQDSHELLRCLLDGLHMEEESIRKAQFGMDKKVESGADSNSKDEDGSLEKAPKKPDTLVEYMFGGQYSSTVTCCECGHSSVVYEPFLDLSLPIPSKQSFGKTAEPIGVPKLFAPRSKRENPSGNGILSLKAAQISPFVSGPADDVPTAIKDQKKVEVPPPIVGFNLERNISAGDTVDSENSNGNYSRSEDKRNATIVGKDHVGKVVRPPATPLPCESLAEAFVSCGKTNSTNLWSENVDKPIKETAVEGGGKVLIDAQRIGSDAPEAASRASHANQSRDVEVNSQEEPSTKYGEEADQNPSRGIISTQGVEASQTDESLAVFQLEETVVPFGPHLPFEGYGCAEDQCMALPLLPPCNPSLEVEMQTVVGCSEKPLAGDQSSMNQGSTLTSEGQLGSFVSVEEGEVDVGIGGLFDDIDCNSPSRNDTAPESQVLNSIDFGSFNSMDALVISDGRSGSVRDFCEEDIYPTMSLEGCLQAFTKTEVLSGENAWACENCTRIAHGRQELDQLSLREREQETNCLDKLSEAEECSVEIRPISDTDNSGEGGWESVSLVHREGSVEDLIGSTNSMSMIVVSTQETVESVQKVDQSDWGMVGAISKDEFSQLDVQLNNAEIVDRRAGSSLAELRTVDGTEEPQPFNAKEDGEEPHVIVGKSFANADERDENIASIISKSAVSPADRAHKPDINGKASANAALKAVSRSPQEEIGKKKLEKDVTKMVSVKRDATKRLLISKAPLVLTVHLKRFAQDTYGRLSKLGGHITFHEELDLGPFIDQRDSIKQDGVYQLIGTVEHSGTMRGGHYVAYVKGESEDSTEGKSTWYYISDSHVRKTSLDDVLQSEAYLLFYERRAFDQRASTVDINCRSAS